MKRSDKGPTETHECKTGWHRVCTGHQYLARQWWIFVLRTRIRCYCLCHFSAITGKRR